MLGYTLAQFMAYVELSCQRERRTQRQQLINMALAMHGGKGLQAALKALED